MLKEALVNKLFEIEQCLNYNRKIEKQFGVLSGSSGVSLFYFYYSKFSKNTSPHNVGISILEDSILEINEGRSIGTFCSGIAGNAWVFMHLEETGLLSIEADDLLIDLDDILLKLLDEEILNGNFDYLHGALGYAYYYYFRYKNTKCTILRNKYKVVLDNFIISLTSFSKKQNGLIKWESKFGVEADEVVYNLGLSHGMASIINFLSRLYVHTDFKSNVEELLKGSIKFVLSMINKDKDGISLFPNIIKTDEVINYNSRVSWCYGDLGIGLSIFKASVALDDEEMKSKAICILKNTSLRRELLTTNVYDAGLCHGSFGIALIFDYLFKETGIDEFKDATLFWSNDGLTKLHHEDGLAGYKKWTLNGWEDDISLLEGISGVGLAIMSLIGEDRIKWDECLMIS